MDQNYPSLRADELATKARATLRNRELRVLPVVDERKHLIGLVSRGGVMTITSSISPIQVRGIMSTPRFVTTMDMDTFHAVREIIRLDEWYVPVVKSSQDYT
jgi:CBS-domain-containing membrane protein